MVVMCEYFNFKDGLQDPKFTWKSMGIYKLLYLGNGELILNFSTVKTFEIDYFIIKFFR